MPITWRKFAHLDRVPTPQRYDMKPPMGDAGCGAVRCVRGNRRPSDPLGTEPSHIAPRLQPHAPNNELSRRWPGTREGYALLGGVLGRSN